MIHCTVCSEMPRSVWIEGIATFTIATSSTVMKKAAPRMASVSQRRDGSAAVGDEALGIRVAQRILQAGYSLLLVSRRCRWNTESTADRALVQVVPDGFRKGIR